MWRMGESMMGSYAGRMQPPGSPNMTSTPSNSRLLIRAWAPVSFIGSFSHGLANGVRKLPRPPGGEVVDARAGASARQVRSTSTRPAADIAPDCCIGRRGAQCLGLGDGSPLGSGDQLGVFGQHTGRVAGLGQLPGGPAPGQLP